MIEFKGFGKISRLNREIVITEKIDGTNAAIGVTEDGQVYAQSRTRLISPESDNFGFAAWVEKHADVLREHLGPGLHFGEWWGVGIQRGYGLSERRFSLFNTARWGRFGKNENGLRALQGLGLPIHVVPTLYRGSWVCPNLKSTYEGMFAPFMVLDLLKSIGSFAAGGYMDPEGIVIFHTAGNLLFKVTLEKDAEWKGAVRVVDENLKAV